MPHGQHIAHPKLRERVGRTPLQCNAPPERGLRAPSPGEKTAPYERSPPTTRPLSPRPGQNAPSTQRHYSYVCTICSSHVIYRPDQLDFFAALVIPTDTWYILPIRATHSQPTVVLSPHLKKSKYGPYEEAWAPANPLIWIVSSRPKPQACGTKSTLSFRAAPSRGIPFATAPPHPHRKNSKYSIYKEAWHLLMTDL